MPWRGEASVSGPTLSELGFDGRAALEAVLARSVYQSPAQAVAALTAFSHPHTVAQIPGGALFPCVRSLGRADRRTFALRDGRKVGLDDNAVAHAAFVWSNHWRVAGRDIQLNHIYPRRSDPGAFTALANLCAGPSFLAKLTDHDPAIAALLQWRVQELYGWAPAGVEPQEPAEYAGLVWAAPLPATQRVESVLRARMKSAPKHFAVRIAREIGWAFSGFEPDPLC